MTDEPIPSLAEAMAEIRRLGAEIEFLQRMHAKAVKIFGTERDALNARVLDLETAAAVTLGTLAQPAEDAPTVITHGHAPSAPPYNEAQPLGKSDE
jgi:hypothetical protein